jgi:hypothetical protein
MSLKSCRLRLPPHLVTFVTTHYESIPSAQAIELLSSGPIGSCASLRTSFEVDQKSLGALLNGLVSNPSVERALTLNLQRYPSSAPTEFAQATAARSADLRHLTALRVAISQSDVGTMVKLAKQLKGLRCLELDVHGSTVMVRTRAKSLAGISSHQSCLLCFRVVCATRPAAASPCWLLCCVTASCVSWAARAFMKANWTKSCKRIAR